MSIEDLNAHRRPPQASTDADDFLIEEGLDLLAAFRAIRSRTARKSVIALITSIVDAERDAEARSDRPPTTSD